MIVEMDNMPVPSWETARRIYEKNIELDNRRGKSAQARIPSDPNIWQQMRENYEKIILEDHSFSEKHNIEHALWQLHYKRIEELRAHYTAAQASANSNASSNGKGPSSRPDRITKIRLQFKTFLSEASGFYHELILKIRSKYGLPLCYFSEDADNGLLYEKDGKNSADVRKVLISCHRCLIYLGDLARYKGLYGEPDSKAREFAAASSYYLQAASLWPSIGNPHHQLAILASYSGDDLVTIYRYFRSLAVANPCSTARDNLIVIFEKNRQSYSQLHIDARTSTVWSAGKGRGQQAKVGSNDTVAKAATFKKSEPNSHDTYKSLCICYVRLNGILFTRSSLETFAEVVSLVVTGLSDLLSSGPEEKMNFGKDAFENGLFFVRLVSTLIFTIHNVKRESEGQTYAEIVQSTVLLQNAFTAVFEIMGHVMKRCEQVHGPSLSYLLPGILVFVEWLASYPDFARGCGNDEKQATARSNFWSHYVSLMNKLLSMGLMSIDDCKDESCFGNTSKFEEGETGNQLALWEDFELRGFLPLVPAQTILDFTMKHSFGSEGHREKCFRVKRTLAAWKVLVGVVKINDKMVCYDSEAKKFVIGVESQLSGEDLSPPNSTVLKANNLVLENLGKTAVKFEESLPKSQLYVEGEDKDEKIVFQLTAVEKRPDTALQNLVPFGTLEPQKNDFIGNSYRKSPYVAMNYLVGIDKQVEDMMDLLDLEVSDVRIVGIWGKGGVGKTTLAKVIYEQISSRFDCSSFLADITATVKHLGGVRLLQSKLMSDILKLEYKVDHVAKGVEFFKEILRKMKVLIVLDDVEVWSHLHEIVGEELDWFGNGSRIIVTTTIINVLPEFISHGLAHVYSINMMDNDQALELFRKHALHRNPPILDIDEIAKGIINSVNRNPLLIEVIGSLLYRKVVEEWTALEEFLQSGLDIEDILEVSYEELSKEQREIFLDIACLPADVDYRMASYMWHNPHFLPSDGVDALHVMSLVKVGKNNELGMHRLLREFGKQIIKKEDYLDPGKRGRLCNLELPSISETEGTDHLNFVAEDFKSMPNIRFLILDCANVFGDFANVFPNLKWLQWQGCTRDFEATNFHVEKLVVLDLSWSKVTEDWGGWREIKMPQLKVLNLTGCGDLLISPNLSSFPDLEILILERCSRLMKLDSSIRHLKYLTSLNLRFCNQLNMLPIELGHLKALKELLIDGTSVQEIPMSMGYMERLEIFSASNCLQLSHLPDSVFRLIALSVLSLENAKITQISNSVEKLVKLRHLSLRDCRWIGRLPDSICHLEGLEQLDISGTGISILPDSITCLRRLKVLKMDYCFIRELPREIGSLANLEELHASHCRSLKGAIPTAIKSLDHLRILRLGHSSISSIPLEIISLSCLQTFDLLQCNKIQALPELPSSLTCVRVSSERMRALPDLKNLVKLEEICLGDKDPKELICPSIWMKPRASLRDPFVVPIGLPKLKILELSHSRIIDLRFRCGSLSCTHLEKLVLSGVNLQEVSELPASLSVLSIQHCSSLKRLSAVQHLRRLSELNLIQSAVKEIKGLEGLIALEILNILYCEIQNLNGLGQLRALRRLILSDCNSLDRLPDISHLKMLNVLEVQRCGMIHDIEGLMELTSLEVLHVSECKAENTQQVQGALNLMMARSVNT